MSASSGRNRRNEDEMFLNTRTASAENTAPVIAPLRIQKRASGQSTQSFDMAAPSVQQPPTSGPTYPMPALPVMPNLPQVPGLPYPDPRARSPPSNLSASSNLYQYSDSARSGTSSSHTRNDDPGSPLDPTLRVASAASARSQASTTLAERRGNNPPKPLPDSPGPDAPDKDEVFQRTMKRSNAGGATTNPALAQQDFPAPTVGMAAQAAFKRLNIRDPNTISRLDSTASIGTTRAQRGSPPPPETPVMEPTGRPLMDIEQRYAASGIAGTGTLTALQAQQSAAAQARQATYGNRQTGQSAQQPEPARPWTPTEHGVSTHAPSTVFQGDTEVTRQSSATPVQPPANPSLAATSPRASRPNALDQDMNRLQVSEEPPPAYSSVTGARMAGFPSEKGRFSTASTITPQSQSQPVQSSTPQPQQPQPQPQSQQPQIHEHPAFAGQRANSIPQNGVAHPQPRQQQQQQNQPQQQYATQHGALQRQPSGGGMPQSPPPLPEGWIAHLDPNSGQYYYIHLPTQATQWEFPKGPTPLNLGETPLSPGTQPLHSPVLSFSQKPMNSPMFPMSPGVMSPSFDSQSMMASMNGPLSNPAAFTGPPPSSGVDLYKVAATNGVYFGPYLRYTNMDLELGFWYGSILLITDAGQPPTIHLHQSTDLSPNPRQLKAINIAQHQRWTFYKYEIDLRMEIDGPAKWTYAITSHLGCTRYEFVVAGRYETNWRFIATSGNDFGLNTKQNERAALGGVGYMWKDIMQKHAECGGFHIQLGLGGQISADRIWKEIPSLKQWLAMSGKDNRKNVAWTAAHEEDVNHAYFHYYTSHFDQPYLREAFAQIPHILTIDDHDIFDGFGSYPDYMQFSNMFKNIGRIGIEMYLLFQHHTTLELLRHVSDDHDLFTITGTGWHFIKFLGPAVAVCGPDTRSERNPHQVMAGKTYQGLFPKIAMLPQSVQHCLMMVAAPLIYPRVETMEQLASTVATGKKAVTGAYNMLGRVTSSVAGVVGAKAAVGSGFDTVKRAVGKSGLMSGMINPFGDVGVLDELKDQWTHESKDLERTYLIRTLQQIAKSRSIRFTFVSGSVNTCGAGLVHDPSHPQDHKTMYQIISSSVVAAPPSSYILKFLNSNKPLYIPANGTRCAAGLVSDTKEDMMEIFTTDTAGQPNQGNRRLCARRNYVAMVIFDPDAVAGSNIYGGAGGVAGGSQADSSGVSVNGAREGGKLSLAVDFLVQGDGGYGGVVKFGPVVVPSLEFGR